MEHNCVIRAYRDRDEEGIFELWKAVYPDRQYVPEKWMEWWRWMYQENPSGNAEVWLAEDKGKIVGHYSLIFMRIKVGDKILKFGQNIDLMIHPDYRFKGIFSDLERKALVKAEQEEVYITIGFPNRAAHPGHIKLGWFDVGVMQLLCLPLNPRNALKLKIRNKFLQIALGIGVGLVFNKVFLKTKKPPMIEGLTITMINSFDKRFDELWMRICNQSQIMVARINDYLNWRYHPPDTSFSIFAAEKDHQICGYIVFQQKMQKDVTMCTIFDIIAQSEKIMHCLLSTAIEKCHQDGADVILYSSITNKPYHTIFKRNGFISLPFIEGSYFSIYSSSSRISKEFLGNPQNWLIQTGDSDTI